MADAHESLVRLLDLAIAATKGQRREVVDFKSLRERLGVSSGVFTNWKRRGVSVEGALDAERLLGCSAKFVLDGGSKRPAPPQAIEQPQAGLPERDELLDGIAMFAKAFVEVDPAKRRLVVFALTDLGNHPEEVSNFAQLVRDLLVTKKAPVAAAENENVPPVVGRTQSKLGQDDQRNTIQRRAQK